jgi:hypothetical protein
MEELVDPNYKLDTVSAEKRDVMYIQAHAGTLNPTPGSYT